MNLHMRAPLCFASAMLLTLLTACGGGGSSSTNNNNGGGGTTPPPTTYADMSGNWGFAGTTSTNTTGKPDSYVGGVLSGSASDKTVTGTVHIVNIADPLGQNGGCYSYLTDIPVTGTIDTNKNVTLTSATVSGQVITVTLVYTPGSGSGTAAGTYSIVGGCAGGESGKLVGSTYNNISGSWSGSVKSNSTNLTYSVNSSINQPTTPTGDGIFTLSGTVNFPQSACFGTGTIQSSNNASVLAGGLAIVTITAPDAVYTGTYDTVYAVMAITDPPTAKNMALSYSVSGGSCNGDTGSGTMTRP